jgi:hypothetical protein
MLNKLNEKIRNSIIVLCSILFIGTAADLNGQKETDLPAEQVEVLKSFEAQLSDVKKIQATASLPPIDSTPIQSPLHITDIRFDLPYITKELKPLALRSEKSPESYRGFVELAGGSPNRLDLKGMMSWSQKGQYDLQLTAAHDQAKSNRIAFQQHSNQNYGVRGLFHLSPEYDLALKMSYDRHINYFYGHPEADTLNRQALRRRIGIFNAGGTLKTSSPDVVNNFSLGIDITQLLENFATNERQFIVSSTYFRKINDKHKVGVDAVIDITRLQDTTVRNLNNFLLNPYYSYYMSDFTLRAGLKIFNHLDEFSYYPDISASYALSGSQLQIEAGVTGGLEKNGFLQLYNYNPFIQSRLDRLANTRYFKYYAGIKGARGSSKYRVQGGYQKLQDWTLFLYNYDLDQLGAFELLFDDVESFFIQASAQWRILPDLVLDAHWNQFIYKPSIQEKAWHRPGFQSYFKATWHPSGMKWSVTGMAWIEGGIFYKDESDLTKSLGPIVDISFAGKYQFTDQVELFLQLRNLPGIRWSRWQNYPVYTAHILGGIHFRIK